MMLHVILMNMGDLSAIMCVLCLSCYARFVVLRVLYKVTVTW